MKYIIALLIGISVFFIHYRSPVITSTDSVWSIFTAESIIHEKNTSLDEYGETLRAHNYYGTSLISPHYYNTFPIGTSILAVPFVYTINKALALPFIQQIFQNKTGLNKTIASTDIYGLCERFIASIIVAFTAMLILIIAMQYLSTSYALFIVFIFSFCTPVWSTASRALWQHGPSLFMLTLTLICIVKKSAWAISLSSIPLTFAYIIRPTNSISLIIITLYVLIKHRRYFYRFALLGLITITPFFLYNLHIYNAILAPYYLPSRIALNPDFFEAIAANLLSPARGLFIYSPIFLFSIYGIYIKIQSKKIELFDYLIIMIIVLHLGIISSFTHWWAGHSYGPRFFSDMTTYLVYLLIPVFQKISLSQKVYKIPLLLLILCCTSISFFIHYRGANARAVHEWNINPVNIDSVPSRVWDWNDPQFLRGLPR